ncbi:MULTISPECIES: helix-turn-helix domain-containing protein [unclassified Natrinema]|uniref:helix-turn-helix domain-containing protein n=1 Tax=unclassified Natrinema TaxID=2622230 RepID=UPI00026D4C54|nr:MULTISPECIES: helix-turn-helix domain-containing protein [unclassified Natrinema]AFO56490.1 HTH DNA binding domain family protein [Natrinema sp. J7-2]
MPQATLKIKSNEALVSLSESHPETEFSVLGAWPTEDKLRVLVETYTIALPSLEETLSAIPSLTDVEIRHSTDETTLFEVSTPTPPPHGAMANSGIVPSFPLHLENGWFVGELTASREQLSAFRDELEAGEIEYHLVQISCMDGTGDALTARQLEVVELAVEHGYYDSPRRCTLSDLANRLDVNKSVVSRILQRAERHIITAYCSSC